MLGGDAENPDAVDALTGYLDLAARTGTVDRINIQVLGDASSPPVEDLVAFYLNAEELAEGTGIDLYTETHVDRFSHDPRRLLEVHHRLQEASGGRTGVAEQVKYVAIIITIAPIVMIYPLLQRYFIKGVMIGALKG